MATSTGVDPARTALLLMDFQRGVVSGVDDAPTLLGKVVAARRVAGAAGAQIGFVRVAFTSQDYASVSSRNKTFSTIATSRRLEEGSADAEIHPDLSPEEGDIVVTKTRVGAFSTTNLANHLNARGIDSLILAGIATSGVVLSTLRDAADRDYRLFVLGDCCADARADVHRVLIDQVFPRQAEIIYVADLGALFG